MRRSLAVTVLQIGMRACGLALLLSSVLAITAPAADEPDAAVAALRASLPGLDYQRAVYHPLHFKPAIDTATDGECLVCHREVLDARVRAASPAGVRADQSLAWYQTVATYDGEQMTFHQRHLTSAYAKAVMNLTCNFCHQGNDPREESPHVTALDSKGQNVTSWRDNAPAFTNRKMVNPTETCLRCHGNYPAEIMGLSGSWAETRESLESPEAPNGCLSCHAEQFRTNRHKVTYLKNEEIEKLAQKSSDVCFGCHGGRQWYRISYQYPRHPWPGMPTDLPDWAKGRPTESDARFLPAAK